MLFAGSGCCRKVASASANQIVGQPGDKIHPVTPSCVGRELECDTALDVLAVEGGLPRSIQDPGRGGGTPRSQIVHRTWMCRELGSRCRESQIRARISHPDPVRGTRCMLCTPDSAEPTSVYLDTSRQSNYRGCGSVTRREIRAWCQLRTQGQVCQLTMQGQVCMSCPVYQLAERPDVPSQRCKDDRVDTSSRQPCASG